MGPLNNAEASLLCTLTLKHKAFPQLRDLMVAILVLFLMLNGTLATPRGKCELGTWPTSFLSGGVLKIARSQAFTYRLSTLASSARVAESVELLVLRCNTVDVGSSPLHVKFFFFSRHDINGLISVSQQASLPSFNHFAL